MSMRQPKPIQVRLPFTVPKPKKSAPEVRICGICRKKDSKYTCPRCNVAYCSLDCFREQSHAQCSEPFYKTTVLDSISADPKVGLDEKRKMVEMLRRFEEVESEGGNGIEELESEDGEDELLKKLQGIDLETIDSNELFKLLPPKHRDAFISALQNPDSEETRILLEAASQDHRPSVPDVLPWWEYEDLDNGGDDSNESDRPEAALKPDLIPESILKDITPPNGVGKKLVYNAISISIAYLRTSLSFRLPSLAPAYLQDQDLDPTEIKDCFRQLIPFLVDAKSVVRHETLGAAWGSVWEAVGMETDSPPDPRELQDLLDILPSILHPPIMAPYCPKVFLVLSDIYSLYIRPPGKVGGAVPRKLAFYVKALEQLEKRDWLNIEAEVRRESEKLGEESREEPKLEERERLKIV